MKQFLQRFTALILLLFGISACLGTVWADAARASSPVLRIGYCQSDEYFEFDTQLYWLLKVMEAAQLIGPLPDDAHFSEQTESDVLWRRVCALDQSTWRVQLAEDGYCSLKEDYPGLEDAALSDALEEQMMQAEVDFLFTMGTSAGLSAKELSDTLPMMNFLSSDPVRAGIVEQAEYSGQDNVWAVVDPNAFSRSISIMLELFSPKTVGVIYADDADAYIYSGIDVLEQHCKENGIEVLHEHVDEGFDRDGYGDYVQAMVSAAERLAGKADVFVMTTSLLKEDDYDDVLAPFLAADVPVYSINSSRDVEYGALMAVEASDYANIARFAVDTLQQFFRTQSLAELPQLYQPAPYLVINYETARAIGYRPTFDMALSAIKIYG